MAGVKGRSGGARPNSGPKRRPPEPLPADDAREFLTKVMQGAIVPSVAQLDAAKALIRAATVAGGKKEERAEKARKAAAGRFAQAAPPRLVVSNG